MAKKNKRSNNNKAKQPETKLNDPIVAPEKPAGPNGGAGRKNNAKSENRKQPPHPQKQPAAPKAIPAEELKKPKEGTVISSLVGALDEDYREIDDVMSPQTASEASKLKYPTSQRIFFCVGVFILIMAIVGIVSTVDFTKNAISEIANQTGLKNEFAAYIYPVVASDPPAFDKIEDLPSSTIINCSIWQIILRGNTSNYETVNDYYMLIPEIDVEAAAASLFGYGFVIEHQTVGFGNTYFEYNADTKSYTVPANPTLNSYSPRITELSSIGELYTVTVEYMPPSALAIAGIETENEPDKTMIYTISKSKGKMTINSISHTVSEDTPSEY